MQRPLSPHISIYKPQITSILSISHRISGLFLWVGIIGMIAWLWCLGESESTYNSFMTLLQHPLGYAARVGVFFALSFHLLNGIRHLFWDAGIGFELTQMRRSGWGVIVGTFLLTIVLCVFFLL